MRFVRLDNFIMYANEQEQAKQTVTLRQKKLARKKAFGLFEASKQLKAHVGGRQWVCCGLNFSIPKTMHTHVAKQHCDEINHKVEYLLQYPKLLTGRHVVHKEDAQAKMPPTNYDKSHTFPWLPSEYDIEQKMMSEPEGCQVLLFYRYCHLEDPHDICSWQQEFCQRLKLSGKIRIANEGINGTVGGSVAATQIYMDALILHPAFLNMSKEDFKTSKGSAEDFSKGLMVRVCNEIVQMGIEPSEISHIDGGNHITPSEFHQELERTKNSSSTNDTLFVDCRNYYESNVGRFEGACTPNIRKFSYWPEYVDQNLSLFEDKRVVMYCTGGIRCERGSAYLRSKGVCKDVVQLKGGIHRYMEEYPNGLFKGKLFVFDDRYTISSNDSVVAECSYCNKPFDQYQSCSTQHCHQLVLSCDPCRLLGKTACCEVCQAKAATSDKGCKMEEECTCTKTRMRIPNQTSNT
ncbi:thiosulfate sulfurtransferase/rhodanese-like domain-containing protein 2 [Anneissia japonica]|uniref:thiosulfate sulfurtransferase/rhodanese-like domain-containing protein 2 n=1 Tax=Anneissia japonica TaxID=1529436 RepID=UPI001425A01D|nr:thiosulfate sulfurtransferase/rhodanese-like domain-containing protein 2 [Anneissia japonica]